MQSTAPDAVSIRPKGKDSVKTILRCLALALAAGSSAGCLDYEQSLTLNPDLSGTLSCSASLDYGPMLRAQLRREHAAAGKGGEPAAAEIEAAKQRLQKEFLDFPQADFPTLKREMEKVLPPGVQLLSGSIEKQDSKMRTQMEFRFDKFSTLAKYFADQDPQPAGPLPGNPMNSFFHVQDEGPTVLVTGVPLSLLPQYLEGSSNPAEQREMQEVLKGLRVAFKLLSPMEVVESNATRRDGHTLYWEYDLAALEKLPKELVETGFRARLRK